MASKMSDNWVADYEACEAEARELMEKITLCNNQPQNSAINIQLKTKIRQMIKQFNSHINSLDTDLKQSSDSYYITQREVERRQRMLDSLANRGQQMENNFNSGMSGNIDNRTALLGPNYGDNAVASWNTEEPEETRNLSVSEIRQQQQIVLEEQDRNLEGLYSVVVRQKKMAQGIGEELEYQNELIEDIIDHTDRTTDHIIREKRHTEIITRKSDACWYWVIILVLLIAIVVVACIPRSVK